MEHQSVGLVQLVKQIFYIGMSRFNRLTIDLSRSDDRFTVQIGYKNRRVKITCIGARIYGSK